MPLPAYNTKAGREDFSRQAGTAGTEEERIFRLKGYWPVEDYAGCAGTAVIMEDLLDAGKRFKSEGRLSKGEKRGCDEPLTSPLKEKQLDLFADYRLRISWFGKEPPKNPAGLLRLIKRVGRCDPATLGLNYMSQSDWEERKKSARFIGMLLSSKDIVEGVFHQEHLEAARWELLSGEDFNFWDDVMKELQRLKSEDGIILTEDLELYARQKAAERREEENRKEAAKALTHRYRGKGREFYHYSRRPTWV
ncbi:MAG: hypothetical protein ACLP5H_20180 [Desulfomonilaceae bacterium]